MATIVLGFFFDKFGFGFYRIVLHLRSNKYKQIISKVGQIFKKMGDLRYFVCSLKKTNIVSTLITNQVFFLFFFSLCLT